MATGNSLLILGPANNSPPGTVYATLDTVTGASTPAETIPVLDFDDTDQEYADFYCVMPEHYDGGGITMTVMFSAAQAATDVVDTLRVSVIDSIAVIRERVHISRWCPCYRDVLACHCR